jgi:hypothetical protein
VKRSFGTRIGALAGILLGAMAVLATAGPASAQIPTTLRFSADCRVATGTAPQSNGFVDVPTGTRINGGAPVAAPTTVTGLNVSVVYPNGSTAIVNEVIVGGTTITRNAVRVTGGPGAGSIIGGVTCTPTTSTASALSGSAITVSCVSPSQPAPASGVATVNSVTVGFPAGARCSALPGLTTAAADGEYAIAGFPYPLAVDVSGAAPAADLASTPASTDGRGGPTTTALLIGGAVALALVAQVALGRKAWRRRGQVTTG